MCEALAMVPSIVDVFSSIGLWAAVYWVGRRLLFAFGSLAGVSAVHGFIANVLGGKRSIIGAARALLYAHLVTPLWMYAYHLALMFPPLEHLALMSLCVSALTFALCFHVWALTQAGIRRAELTPARALALALLSLCLDVVIYLPFATPDVEPPWR